MNETVRLNLKTAGQKPALPQLVLISDAFEMIPFTKKRNHNETVTFLIILHRKIVFLHNSICSQRLQSSPALCHRKRLPLYVWNSLKYYFIFSLSLLWSSSAEGLFYRVSFVVDDRSMALTQADVERAVALWVRWVRLYAAKRIALQHFTPAIYAHSAFSHPQTAARVSSIICVEF